MYITRDFLRRNRGSVIFVFGDNLLRRGKGGAASLRDEPNAYGFITKRAPDNRDSSFFKPSDYADVFKIEMAKLERLILSRPTTRFYISKLGGGLANRYHIFEQVIQPALARLPEKYSNVILI